jgi:hypothetical protein
VGLGVKRSSCIGALGTAIPFALPFISFGKSILHHPGKFRKGFSRFGK